ncbi:MAG: M56 family metallopeptidase [Pirellulales bacterium]
MNSIFSAQTWHLLGWTMLHFLWLGAALLLLGAVLRRMLRRAGPNFRYAHSLATLLALAALPIATATWLDPSPPSSGEGAIRSGATGYASARSVSEIHTGIASGTQAPPQIIELNPNYNAAAQPLRSPPPGGEGLGEGGIPSGATGSASAPSMLQNSTGKASGTLPPALEFIHTCVPYLPYLWLLGTPLTFALLATGLIGAERMRRHGTPLTAGPLHETCERLRLSLRITRRVTLAVCDRVAQPVLVGIVRPLILLPPVALTGWSPAEIEMVLLHELAHVRRWDNLVNLAQRVIESLLFFHPAVWMVSTWVRRDREECCDAVVVTRTAQPKQYAELLLALASNQPLFGAALACHPLAARLRRILKLEDEPMLVSRNTIGLLTLAVVAIALVAISGPMRVVGEAQPAEDELTPPTEALPTDVEPTPLDSAEQPSNPPPPSAVEGLGEGEKDETRYTEEPLAVNPSAERGADHPSNPLAGIAYPSPREGEIAKRAFDMLGIKVAPATDAELEATRKRGKRGGLKLVDFDHFPQFKGPVILTEIQSTPLSRGIVEFGDLEKVLDAVKDFPKSISLKGTIGNATFEYAMALPSSRAATTAQLPFLSLEDQKIADRAYKLLGIELEPLSKEELERVKKLGFKGGLRVTDANQGISTSDLLVGLHVWPITGLESLNSVLTREDLTEFSPLKFYVVRQESVFVPIDATDLQQGGVQREIDKVVTGRIQGYLSSRAVNLDETMRMLEAAAAATISAATPTVVNPPSPTATSDELEVLRDHVKFVEEQYKRIDALFNEGAKGGSAEKRDLTAYELSRAKGELALALGNRKEALANFNEASKHAEEAVKSATAAYENDVVTYDFLLQSVKSLAEIKRKIIHLQEAKPSDPASSDTLVPTTAPPTTFNSPTRIAPPSVAAPPATSTEPQPVPVFPTPAAEPPPTRSSAALPWNPPTTAPQPVPAQAPLVVQRRRGGSLVMPQPVPSSDRPSSPPPISNQPSALPPLPTSVYRYDGKTFEQWRDEWKHELSTEKRIEAVKALAAFARAGKGKEAAEAILDVAAEYDFQTMDNELRNAITNAFAAQQMQFSEWQPLLRERYDADPARWESTATNILRLARPASDEHRKLRQRFLLDIAKQGTQAQHLAFQALMSSELGMKDEEIKALALDRLKSDDSAVYSWAIMGFADAGYYPPEFVDILLHGDEQKQYHARSSIRRGDEKTRPLVEKLLETLQDEAQAGDHLAAIRALGALGRVAAETDAVDLLGKQFPTMSTPELQIAAAVAIERITNESIPARMGLESTLKDEAGQLLDVQELDSLINKEIETAYRKNR